MKLNKQLVYLPTDVGNSPPENEGDYIVLSKCNSFPLEYYDTLKFQNGKFQEITNWTHLKWLQPQEVFVFNVNQLNELLSNIIKKTIIMSREVSKLSDNTMSYDFSEDKIINRFMI